MNNHNYSIFAVNGSAEITETEAEQRVGLTRVYDKKTKEFRLDFSKFKKKMLGGVAEMKSEADPKDTISQGRIEEFLEGRVQKIEKNRSKNNQETPSIESPNTNKIKNVFEEYYCSVIDDILDVFYK